MKGRSGFKPLVLVKLKGVILHGSSQPDQNVLMVWIKGTLTQRSIKLLIGADVIFKYRLQFFTDLNGHLETKAVKDSQTLSMRENELLQNVRDKAKHRASIQALS